MIPQFNPCLAQQDLLSGPSGLRSDSTATWALIANSHTLGLAASTRPLAWHQLALSGRQYRAAKAAAQSSETGNHKPEAQTSARAPDGWQPQSARGWGDAEQALRAPSQDLASDQTRPQGGDSHYRHLLHWASSPSPGLHPTREPWASTPARARPPLSQPGQELTSVSWSFEEMGPPSEDQAWSGGKLPGVHRFPAGRPAGLAAPPPPFPWLLGPSRDAQILPLQLTAGPGAAAVRPLHCCF